MTRAISKSSFGKSRHANIRESPFAPGKKCNEVGDENLLRKSLAKRQVEPFFRVAKDDFGCVPNQEQIGAMKRRL